MNTQRKPPSSYLLLKGTRQTSPDSNRKKAHYAEKQIFLQKIIDYQNSVTQAEAKGKPIPPVGDDIGEIFLKLARNLANCRRFARYAWREDMELHAVQNCIRCIMNFDKEQFENPFSYFTQVSYWAFVRRIKEEKLVTVGKFVIHERQLLGDRILYQDPAFHHKDGFFNENPFNYEVPSRNVEDPKQAFTRQYMTEFVDTYEKSIEKKATAKKQKKSKDFDIDGFLSLFGKDEAA